MKLSLSLKGFIIGSFCLFIAMLTAYAQSANFGTELEDAAEAREGSSFSFPKERDQIPIEYFGQPPLIPHSIESYQVNYNVNSCLNCHGINTYHIAKATRISYSHIKDNTLDKKHYLCTSCHVEQSNTAPLVENLFKAAP